MSSLGQKRRTLVQPHVTSEDQTLLLCAVQVLAAYSAEVAFSRSPIASAKIPFDALHEVGISYYV